MNILTTPSYHRDGRANRISAFILCGGQSQRMGKDKASLLLHDRQFLDIAKRTTQQAGIAHTFSVGREGSDIVDSMPFRGPAAALINAANQYISSLNCDGANSDHLEAIEHMLVLPVDMPLLKPASLTYLVNHALSYAQSVHFEGERFPFFLYDVKRHQDALNALLSENKTPSLRALIKAVNARGISVPKGFSQSLLNVNTPFEYALIS